MDVYVNEEELSGYPGKRIKRMSLGKSSESIYDNPMIHSLEPDRIGPARSVAGDVRKGSRRAAVVCLLCLLLMIGLITLSCLFSKGNTEWKMKMAQLQTSYKNLTKEQDQLQTSYNNLVEERDQLQSSYNFLNEAQVQLHKGAADMTKKIQDLQTKLQEHYPQHGWTYFSGSLYYISSTEKTWEESRLDCQQRGADLVIINSKEEQDFVRRFQKLLWIGLTDRETEGTWKWVDGTLLTTSYWAPREPNGHIFHRHEDCAEIQNYKAEKSWNDISCYGKKFWICEKTLPP
ncbi:C-type lectin domain family 17, member A-like [Plectropomus leopardus]|uniref:C-type lectin domain family 17, member A-like n=1 Tax=Plectropomus leopardus TaxID=160734 RepID=UPI001C4B5BD6|nr:C-type lectin domain family 17, member A-like [Plectropomus leopardus]